MSSTTDQNRVRLALSSGEVFEGWGFGAAVDSGGEVVFNTAMSGYQESLTDPSYTGQILVQTSPMIGNTGMNERDLESRKIQVSGMVVHEHVDLHSSYRASESLDDQLRAAGVPGIFGVDTRAITTLLRSGGAVQGVICGDPEQTDVQLVQRAQAAGSMTGTDFASGAGSGAVGSWEQPSGEWGHLNQLSERALVPVGVIDCGVKENILRCLMDVGCTPVVLPITTPAAKIKEMLLNGSIYGIFLSNGPGDPGALSGLVSVVRELIQDEDFASFPVFGICLGHQILALAHGARTYKLKFGHRGINHPVLETSSGRVGITSQNHGFAVDEESCSGTGLVVTHRHLNDDTVAGIERRDRPIAGMQYHPEASPGPHDAGLFFARFAVEIEQMLISSRSVQSPI